MSQAAAILALLAAACGAAPAAPASAPLAHRAPTSAEAVVSSCWLGPDVCRYELDLDGDGRLDTIELVDDAPCGASEDDRPCRQGLRLVTAAGDRWLVGAGAPLAADPAAPADAEPLELPADLGFLVGVRARRGAPPCGADALELDGGDAAAQLCVVAGAPRAYHLGF